MADEDKITARLTQIYGENTSKVFDIKGSKVTIGRGYKCDVRLQNLNVSRTHCILNRTDKGWKIMDNRSQNGTYISGRKLLTGESRFLQCGDIIFLGPPAEMPEAFCFDDSFLDENLLKEDNEDELAAPVSTLKRPAELEGTSAPKKIYLELRSDVGKVISNTIDFSPATDCHNDNIPSPSKNEEYIDSLINASLKKFHENKNYQINEISSTGNEEVEDSESLIDAENGFFDFATQVLKRSPCKNLQTPQDSKEETELLKSKLEVLSEQIKLLEKSKSELLKNYEEVCKQNDKQLAEKNQLKEDMKSCELKAKDAVKNELLEKFEEDLICNICTELLIKPTVLDCSHTFCLHCIKEWKKKKNECPICRHKIQTMTPVLTLDNFIDKTLLTLTPEQREKRNQMIKERENAEKLKTTPTSRRKQNGRRRSRGRLNNFLPRHTDNNDVLIVSERRSTVSSLPINLPPLPFPIFINNFNFRRVPETVRSDSDRDPISTIYVSR